MTHTETLIDLAADRLSALAYAGATVYGWRDDASGEVCLASPEADEEEDEDALRAAPSLGVWHT